MIVEGEGAVFGVNLGRPIVTNGAFATRSSQISLRTCLKICETSSRPPIPGRGFRLRLRLYLTPTIKLQFSALPNDMTLFVDSVHGQCTTHDDSSHYRPLSGPVRAVGSVCVFSGHFANFMGNLVQSMVRATFLHWRYFT